MYLFGLEGSGFIISLGLIFFMSGLIMFYCLRRFSLIENSIIDQGRILQSFIIKTQEQGMVGCPQHPATNRAIASALEQSKDDSLYSVHEKLILEYAPAIVKWGNEVPHIRGKSLKDSIDKLIFIYENLDAVNKLDSLYK